MSIKPGKYRHYKGKDYEVLGVALHSETLEEMVVYRALYQASPSESLWRTKEDGNFWVRPVKMFLENVEIDGKQVPRFEFIAG